MKELESNAGIKFLKLERPGELEKFHIHTSALGDKAYQFDFFKGLGMVDYEETFKIWLREFPKPIFIIAVKEASIVGWVYIEEWGDIAKDGDSIYILRAIETAKGMREGKLGFRLVVLGLRQIVGYLLTKPMNAKAEKFFKDIGFMEREEFKRCPIELRMHPGYIIFPPFKKRSLLERSTEYFGH